MYMIKFDKSLPKKFSTPLDLDKVISYVHFIYLLQKFKTCKKKLKYNQPKKSKITTKYYS